MTVQSYNGNLDFGFIACRELVPDLWSLVDYLHESLQELLDSIGTSTPATTKAASKRPAKAAAKKAGEDGRAKTATKKAAPARTAGTRQAGGVSVGSPSRWAASL